ncbi:hypothetical protein EVAR_49656_1 [Eumeta japonica]|uniref:Uncharacterized protein n=1 Tax=Eumeta variegata TaxID=151549 RepID=A0A4C1Y762_EUMVA|nr:hypothetical protein EVAR_49656_1 [Eumeta japonica]
MNYSHERVFPDRGRCERLHSDADARSGKHNERLISAADIGVYKHSDGDSDRELSCGNIILAPRFAVVTAVTFNVIQRLWD